MRAVVLGGTGAIGGAVADRLAASGWSVDVTGRDPASMPRELVAAGVRFHRIERSRTQEIDRLVGDGVDLLLDAVAFTAADVRALLPVMARAVSPVLVSTAAVYLDPQGRHVNGEDPPRFPGPISEDAPTLAPAGDGILDSADPNAPTAAQIVVRIAQVVGWEGRLELLDAGADPAAGGGTRGGRPTCACWTPPLRSTSGTGRGGRRRPQMRGRPSGAPPPSRARGPGRSGRRRSGG